MQRFKFYNRAQGKGETIAVRISRVLRLWRFLIYYDTRSLGLWCNHEGIQCRLLAAKDLTYKKAHELVVTLEAAAKGNKDISTTTTQQIEPFVNDTKGVNFKQRSGKTTNSSRTKLPDGPQIKTCYWCGDRHLASQCKFWTAGCHRCHKTGHIAKVCKSKLEEKSHHSGKNSHHYLEEIPDLPDTDDSSYGLFTLQSETHDPILIQLEQNVPVRMELDTGALLTLINKASYDLIAQNGEAALEQPVVNLRTYTGEAVKMLGSTTVEVKYGEKCIHLTVYVVEEKGPNLLGIDWLSKLNFNQLDIHTIVAPSKLDKVLDKHALLFKDGLSMLTDVKVKLQVDQSVPPKFFKASIPFALKGKVEAELESLEAAGIISPVSHSDWAAPIVPVMKQNGRIRICGDYRVTVNQAIKVDSYPLPRVEDLFSALAEGKYFSKLDISQAYLQLPLDEASKQYVTVNTHKGLFKYNRLPFGYQLHLQFSSVAWRLYCKVVRVSQYTSTIFSYREALRRNT